VFWHSSQLTCSISPKSRGRIHHQCLILQLKVPPMMQTVLWVSQGYQRLSHLKAYLLSLQFFACHELATELQSTAFSTIKIPQVQILPKKSKPNNHEIWQLLEYKILWQANPISCVKTFGTLECSLAMYEVKDWDPSHNQPGKRWQWPVENNQYEQWNLWSVQA